MKLFESDSFSSHIWPGFVDLLSALLTVILFVFMIFMVSYVHFSHIVGKKAVSLSALNVEISQLKQKLLRQEAYGANLAQDMATRSKEIVQLIKETEKWRLMYQKIYALLEEKKQNLLTIQQKSQAEISAANEQLAKAKNDVVTKQTQLNQANARIQEMLAHKVKELSNYRSEFLGQMRQALKNCPEIRIAGDRFVFSSEVIFNIGEADIGPKGQKELIAFAKAFKEMIPRIPEHIPWVLRINGHTDNLPIRPGRKFSSNLELSSARAIAVVNFLIAQGIPACRLIAAGLGEFHPLAPLQYTDKDRRIEFILDEVRPREP
jgi:chemotaxis protein MotB